MLGAYSSIGGNFQITLNGASYTFTSSYTTLYASATTFKVSIVSSDYPSAFTMWLMKNGSLVGINYAGSNYTGAAAISYYQASRLFTAWGTQTVFGQQLTSVYIYATAYFHSTGTSPVTLGTNTFTLTNYAANSLPETLPTCSGASVTLTAATMAIGTPNGANYPFPFQVNVVGSSTGGTTGNVTFTISSQITSVTVA
ncbi:MAG: hypothetical protein ABSA72_10265 [Nitrososphaerales archaeon]|jgi:hypothetical protein